MPTIAKAGRLDGSAGKARPTTAAKAPPSVAPMNSDGEKMPPDEPEPRLSDVASELAQKQQRKQPRRRRRPPVRIAWIVA